MTSDRFGLTFTTKSAAAAGAYLDAVDRLLAADAGAIEAAALAVEHDQRFALAHVALARSYQIAGRGQDAQAAVSRAVELCTGGAPLSERERGHVHALAAVVRGQADALDKVKSHVAQFPRDALVLAPGVAVFGLIGFSGRKRRNDELLDWMNELAPVYAGDWWFGAWYGFLHTETGHFERGRELVWTAYAQNPRNANAAHAVAHAFYEGDGGDAGMEFLRAWLPRYARAAPLHCHLSWHLALFELERGRSDEAWQVFADAVDPAAATQAPPINALTDSAAFLWRAQLAGQNVPPPLWQRVADFGAAAFPAGGVDFVDVHAVMALVGAGETDRLRDVLTRLRAEEGRGGGIAAALSEALAAYGAKDWERVAHVLEARADDLIRVGGSGAQRDVFEHTLLSAWLRAGRPHDAQRWLQSRSPRPRHETDRVLRLLARAVGGEPRA